VWCCTAAPSLAGKVGGIEKGVTRLRRGGESMLDSLGTRHRLEDLLLPAADTFLVFTLSWIFLCRLHSSLLAKRFGQIVQRYGFSPVCVRMCVRKWSLREKRRLHSVQTNGLSPETKN